MTIDIEMVSVYLVFVQNLDSLILALEFKGFVHLNGFHLIQKFDGIFLFGRRRRQLSTVICLLQFYSLTPFFQQGKKLKIPIYTNTELLVTLFILLVRHAQCEISRILLS